MPHRVFLTFALLVLAGCSRQGKQDDAKVDVVAVPPQSPVDAAPKVAEPPELPRDVLFASEDPARQAYESALARALNLLADQNLPKALEAFEEASQAKETPFVRGEIEKLRGRIDADLAAQKTIAEIEAVLDAGNPEEAGKLASQALKSFGGGAAATELIRLQAQADALVAAASGQDDRVRFQRLRDQGQTALQDDNLRAAAASFAQALGVQADAGLAEQLQEIQNRLDKYDALRKRAAELRRDPAEVDDALEIYREAAGVWNTPEVRQDIDDCLVALQRRRDTIGVAAFEVIGDVGVAGAGEIVADELLPTFKTRFDLVDRDHVRRVAQDLNLPATALTLDQQRELGRLARARFLVTGSVRRLGTITVHARLVDASSGLVVQTARVSAASFDELVPRLPELTRQLLMSDEEKLAFDQEQIRQAARIEPVAVEAPLPPQPEAGGAAAGPWFDAAPPPAFGQLQIAQFRALPPPQPGRVAPAAVVVEPPPVVFRDRLVHTVVLQGDGYFARRHFREAYRQYEFALSLAPNDFDIRARLDACRPLLPPAPVVVVAAPRPRLAMLNFYVVGDPQVVPPGLSVGVPNLLAPYLRANFDLVDSGEIYWMMGRLGLTQHDLMSNPTARRWLGRALNAQFFLLGTVEETASFNVNTYLINAENGWLDGSAGMHVRNPYELKLRAGELAHVTQLPPAQAAQFVAAQPQVNVLMARGQESLRGGEFQIAITFFQQALALRPNNVQANLLLTQATQSRRQWEIEEARRREVARQKAAAAEADRRRIEVAQAAEAARRRAVQQAASRAEAERLALAKQRAAAYGDMVVKARVAVQGQNFALAIQLFQGALDLVPPPAPGAAPAVVAVPVPHDALLRELGQARAAAARANEQKAAAQQAAAREQTLRLAREKELAAAKQKLALERRQAEAEAAALQKLVDARYQAAFDQGQLLMSQEKFESAIVALQGARQIKKTEAVEALLNVALSRQAEAVAQAKGAAERKALDEKLAAERQRRKAAEAAAKRNQEIYEQALDAARDALARKDLDDAERNFESAGKLFKTDAVLAGLKQVQSQRSSRIAAQKAVQDREDRIARLLSAGAASLEAGKFAESVATLEQARKLDPENADVLSALSRAEQARRRSLLEEQRKALAAAKERAEELAAAKQKALDAEKQKLVAEAKQKALDADKQKAEDEQKKALAVKQLKAAAAARSVEQGRKALAAKDYAAAIDAFQDALKLTPDHPLATEGLQQARLGQQSVATAAANARRYQQLVAQGQTLLNQRKFPEAIDILEDAIKLQPGDPAASLLRQAQGGLAQEQAKQKAEAVERKRKTAYADAIEDAVRLGRERQYAAALKSLEIARSLYPTDPTVQQLINQTTQAWESAKKSAPPPTPKKTPPVDTPPEKPKVIDPTPKPPPPKTKPADPKPAPPKTTPPKADPPKKAAANRSDYDAHIARGQQLLKQGQPAAAAQQFEAALRLMPGDPIATRLLQAARTPKK